MRFVERVCRLRLLGRDSRVFGLSATAGLLAVVALLLVVHAPVASADGAQTGAASSGGASSNAGVVTEGAVGSLAAPVPQGLGGGGPSLRHHGALSPAPATLSVSAGRSADVVHADDMGGSPDAPTGLTEVPLVGVSLVESTTPTFSAVYNNSGDSDAGYVQYEILTTDGTVIATGQGTTVSPGSVSTWNYPTSAAPLQVGEEYDVEAESVSGTAGSGYDTDGSFRVDSRLVWGAPSWSTNVTWHPDSQMTVGVDVADGDMSITMAMLRSAAGVSFPIDLSFVSNSGHGSENDWDLGRGWRFSQSLYVDPSGNSITYYGPNGQSAAFVKSGSSWNSPGDLPATLTTTGSGYQLVWNTADSIHSAGETDTFDGYGDLVEEESATGQTVDVAYDDDGAPETLTTSTGHSFDFNYYTSGAHAGALESITESGTSFEVQIGWTSGNRLDSITNPDGGETDFGYQASSHQITSITTPAGRELDIAYDSTGTRVSSVSQVDSDFSTDPTWSFSYTQPTYVKLCETDDSAVSFDPGQTVVQDPDGNSTTYVWDNADRVTSTTDAKGETTATTWNADNDVTSVTGPNDKTETFAWDAAHDVLDSVTNPSEPLAGGGSTPGSGITLQWNTTSAPYTLASVADTGDASSGYSYSYNAAGEVTEVHDHLGSDNSETATYQGTGGTTCGGLAGDICSVTDFDGNTTDYGYDSAGELTSITPPDQASGNQLGPTSFGYNALGEVTSEEDGRGDTTTYAYNGEGQVTSATNQDGTEVDYTYDADGNLTWEESADAGILFTYNNAGLLSESQDYSYNYYDPTTYGYDSAGNLTSLDGSNGDETYSYNSVNEPTQVDGSWAGTITLGYVPNDDRLLQTVDLPGSVTETYGYDNAGRATSYTVTDGSGTDLIDDSYSYLTPGDTDSELMQSSTDTSGTTTTYSYDPLDRLTAADAGSASTSSSYTYNGDGGMTSQDLDGDTQDFPLNETNENENDTYDAAGNLTEEPSVLAATYNTAGQTASVTPDGGDEEDFTYIGQTQSTPAAGANTFISYNALGVDETFDYYNYWSYLRAPNGQLLAGDLLADGDSSNIRPYYYLLDPSGSVVGMTDSSGAVVDSYSYSPYGIQNVGSDDVDQPYGYKSGLEIPNTDPLQIGGRLYETGTGTFTQRDRAGQDGGYAYADDDPINSTDTPQPVLDAPSVDIADGGLKAPGGVAPDGVTGSGSTDWIPGVEVPDGVDSGPSTAAEGNSSGDLTGLQWTGSARGAVAPRFGGIAASARDSSPAHAHAANSTSSAKPDDTSYEKAAAASFTAFDPETTPAVSAAPSATTTSAQSVAESSSTSRGAPGSGVTSSSGLTPVVASVIGQANSGYWIQHKSSKFVTDVGGSKMEATFGDSRVTVGTRDGAEDLGLASVGRGSTLRPIDGVKPAVRTNRVEYTHPGVREVDENGPNGIEQTFEIFKAPRGSGTSVVLRLATSGPLRPKLDKDADGVTFVDSAGTKELHYDQLAVRDATGRVLPARMSVTGRRIGIHIDVKDAVYPVSVDPYIQEGTVVPGNAGPSTPGFTDIAMSGNTMVVCDTQLFSPAVVHAFSVTPGESGAAYVLRPGVSGWGDPKVVATLQLPDGFSSIDGCSVAMSGSTIVLGESEPFAASGNAFVYTEPSGGWTDATPTATLSESDAGASNGDSFGQSVAIDGNTIAVGAPYAATEGQSPELGGVYIFEKPAGGWTDATEDARLYNGPTASDSDFGLGGQVALADGFVAATATRGGPVFEWTEPAGGWASESPKAYLTDSAGGAFYGSVTASDNTIAATAVEGTGYSQTEQQVDVFSEPSGGWADATETSTLQESASGANADLSDANHGLVIANNTIFAASPEVTDQGVRDAGEVFRWVEPTGGWTDMSTQTDEIEDLPAGFPGGAYSLAVDGRSVAVLGSLATVFHMIVPHSVASTRGGGRSPMARTARVCPKADPVNCATGDFYEPQTDLSLPVPGGQLALTRTYDTQAAAAAGSAGMFGYGWSATYTDQLQIDPADGVDTVVFANGSQVPFTITDSGLEPPPGEDGSLTANADGTYTLMFAGSQETYLFSSSGQLQSETDRYGDTTTLAYDGSGRLQTITAPGGRSITLSYNSDGTVSQSEDSAGRTVEYGYTNGDLTTVTDVRGGQVQFGYDSQNRMTSMTTPNGNVTTNTYDSQNRVIEQDQPGGRDWTWSYPYPDETEITDPDGNVEDEYFDADFDPTGVVQGVGSSDPATTLYAYDDNLNPSATTDPDGNTTSYSYDASGNELSETDPLGNTSSWTYNAGNQVTSSTRPSGETTTYTYTGGNLTNVSSPINGQTQQTTLAYDDPSDPSAVTSATDPDGHTTTYTYDSDGDLTSETDPDGDETTFGYNAAGEQTSSTTAKGNVAGADAALYTTSSTYDAAGNLTGSSLLPSLLDTSAPGDQLGSYPITTGDAGARSAVLGADGDVWFTESAAGNIAKVTPSGAVIEYSTGASGSSPDGLTVGSDGDVWFTDPGTNSIGQVTSSGSVTEWPVPDAGSDPTSIDQGPDGTLRFTESGNSAIGTFDPSTDEFQATVSTPTSGSEPASIVSDGNGDDYFLELDPATNVEQIAEIDSSGTITETALKTGSSPDPSTDHGPGETVIKDGKLWATDWGNSDLVEMDLSTGDVSYTAFPTGTTGITALTAATDGAIWFTEQGSGTVGELDPGDGSISQYNTSAASGGGIVQGPDGNIWTTDPTGNTIDKLASGLVNSDKFAATASASSPADIVATSDGTVWFTEPGAGNIAKSTPAGTITEYATGGSGSGSGGGMDCGPGSSGSSPDGLTVGSGGDVWFTDPGTNSIGKVTSSGSVTEWTVPDSGSDPTSIARGPGGTLRFTESGNGAIGMFDPSTDEFGTTISTPTTGSEPGSIVSDGSGDDYFLELDPATNVEQVGEIDSSGTVTETALKTGSSPDPSSDHGPGETVIKDGKLWATDWGNSDFVEMDLSSGDVTYTPFPTGVTGVTALTAATDGAIWFTEQGSGTVGVLDPSNGSISQYTTSAASGGGIVQGADGNVWTTDPAGNEIQRLSLAPVTTKSAYDADGNLTSSTDVDGQTTTYAYDEVDEPVSTTEPNGVRTSTTYDDDGNVTSQTDGRGKVTSYTYNALNQQTTSTDPDSNETQYSYDPAGNLLTVTDPEGRVTTYTPNADGQTTSIDYSDGTTPSVAYTYNPDGTVQTMVDGTGTTTYTYDALDRLTSVQDGNGDTIGYGYDLADNETSITYPGDHVVAQTFDDEERLSSVQDWLGNTTTFGYDPDGDQTTTSFPGTANQTDTYTYDNTDDPTGSTVNANGSQTASLAYTYDPDGNLTQQESTGLGDSNHTYAYTDLGQLAADNDQNNDYDPDGNLTQLGGSGTASLAYDDADQLTQGPAGTYTYNPLGERTQLDGSGGTTSYSWDQAGDFTGAQTSDGAVNLGYGYDGNGLLQSSGNGTSTSQFTWDPNNDVPLLIAQGGTDFIYGPGDLPIEQIGTDGTPLFYHHDQLGSTVLLTNTAGTKIETIKYSAYGDPTITSGTASTPLLYGGAYTDPTTGLQYLQARWYDPSTGQFLSVDPLEAITDAIYGYAGGDPITGTDPSGEGGGAIAADCQAGEADDPEGGCLIGGAVGLVSDTLGWLEGGIASLFSSNSDAPSGTHSDSNDGTSADSASSEPDEPVCFGDTPVGGDGDPLSIGNIGTAEDDVPVQVQRTLDEIDRTGSAPAGYKGGGTFANDGRGGGEVLPQTDADGNPITYKEYDLHPYQQGVNRGAERLVTGSNGSAYFTTDHYQTFTQIR